MAVTGGRDRIAMPRILLGFLAIISSVAWAEGYVVRTWIAPDTECRSYHEMEGAVTACIIPSRGNYANIFLYGQPVLFEFHYHNTAPYGRHKSEPLDVAPLLKAMPLDARLPNGEWVSPDVDIFAYLDTPTMVPPGYYYVALIDLTGFIGTDVIGEYEITWGTRETGQHGFGFEIRGPTIYYPRLLDRNIDPERWDLASYGETGGVGDGLAKEAIAYGNEIAPSIIPFLTNTDKYHPFDPPDPKDPFQVYGWRVCDFAGIILTEIWGQPPGALRSKDPVERDKRLQELQLYYRIHEQEFKE